LGGSGPRGAGGQRFRRVAGLGMGAFDDVRTRPIPLRAVLPPVSPEGGRPTGSSTTNLNRAGFAGDRLL